MTSELFTIACEDRQLLEHRLDQLAAYLERSSERPLALIARNLADAPEHGTYRFAAVANDRGQLIEHLRSPAADRRRPTLAYGLSARPSPRTLWLFPGHGLVSIEVGQSLLQWRGAFSKTFQECLTLTREVFGVEAADAVADPVASTASAMSVQLRLFSLQAALAAQWRAWGVRPDGVLGHSLGEVGAAYAAGAIALADGVLIAGARGALLNTLRGQGAMLGVETGFETLAPLIEPWRDRLSIAAINANRSIVVSGDGDAIQALETALAQTDTRCQRLADVAGHRAQIDALTPRLLERLHGVSAKAGDCAIYSTVEARRISGDYMTAGYWARNLRQTVRFAETWNAARADGYQACLELGPHPLLSPYVEGGARYDGEPFLVIPNLRRGRDDRTSLLRAAARLYVAGATLDRRGIVDGWSPASVVELSEDDVGQPGDGGGLEH